MPVNYTFIISPGLLNRFEEVRQHHIVKYGPSGTNSDLITFIISVYLLIKISEELKKG